MERKLQGNRQKEKNKKNIANMICIKINKIGDWRRNREKKAQKEGKANNLPINSKPRG